MAKLSYAIVDIETTGGSPAHSDITEIAVRIFDGTQIVERWDRLIRPRFPIPLSITALTGIDANMVCDAPTFAEVAKDLYDLLHDRVFVAHHVNFDYSFLKKQLAEAGFEWRPKKLCTVRLARKFFPGLASYSLGKLCLQLSIPLVNRHRAGGDADATAILFEKILRKDADGEHIKMLRISAPEQRLPSHLDKEEFESLPASAGVYYFHDSKGKVIYVGKAINIKKRVYSHFTGMSISTKRQCFLRDIHHVSYEICGTELIAQLQECIDIKKYWPIYNQSLKKFEPKFGLYHFIGQSGYDYLVLGRYQVMQPCVRVFLREYDAINTFRKLIARFDLSFKYCRIATASQVSSRERSMRTDEPDVGVDEYRLRVLNALEAMDAELPSLMVIDRGREQDEISCVLMEHGIVTRMGFISSDIAVERIDEAKEFIPPIPSNYYMSELVLQYAAKFPNKTIQ